MLCPRRSDYFNETLRARFKVGTIIMIDYGRERGKWENKNQVVAMILWNRPVRGWKVPRRGPLLDVLVPALDVLSSQT